MRGFSKATALLWSAVASAFVVPDTPSSAVGRKTSTPVVQYHASGAFLTFNLDTFHPQGLDGEDLNLTLAVGELQSSDKPCGQSNLRFLDHHLPSNWNGNTAKGSLVLTEFQPPIAATWQIICLFQQGPKESRVDQGPEVTQVLTLAVRQKATDHDLGFTVSYTQVAQPRILRFRPQSTGLSTVESESEYWRTPSALSTLTEKEGSDQNFTQSTNSRHTTLKGHFEAASQYILNTFTVVRTTASKIVESCRHHVKDFEAQFRKAMGDLCPEKRKQDLLALSSSTENQHLQNSPDRLIQAPTPVQTRVVHPTYRPDTPNTPNTLNLDAINWPDYAKAPDIPNTPGASETLSISSTTESSDTVDIYPTPKTHSIPAAPVSSSAYRPPTGNSLPSNPIHFLKLLFIALSLFFLLTWLIIQIRDPRRRADRAARREERQNRKLYRRAAWAHWWQTRVCALRHRHCPRSQGPGTPDTWDEKCARVFQQEGILENVCQEDIRHLRAVTRPRRGGRTNSLAAAEEGRNTFLYDSDSEGGSSMRRLRSVSGRSVTTLPGYESEGTQPPGYSTVDDLTPDSSVVSTSPRISRDGGLGSEDGLWAKEIERLDLGPGVVGRE